MRTRIKKVDVFLLICFETNNPKWYDFKIVIDTTNYVLRKVQLQYPVEVMLTQITVLIYTKYSTAAAMLILLYVHSRDI